MGNVKGNSAANIGYACFQKVLVSGWRKVWSETVGTTDPMAPFGIVTLASSGSEGGPNMGPMRYAQTASYGVLPGPQGSGMENTFLAQAYDLDDEWGPGVGPCFAGWPAGRQVVGGWNCCPSKGHAVNLTTCTPDHAKQCIQACNIGAYVPSHGGIQYVPCALFAHSSVGPSLMGVQRGFFSFFCSAHVRLFSLMQLQQPEIKETGGGPTRAGWVQHGVWWHRVLYWPNSVWVHGCQRQQDPQRRFQHVASEGRQG